MKGTRDAALLILLLLGALSVRIPGDASAALGIGEARAAMLVEEVDGPLADPGQALPPPPLAPRVPCPLRIDDLDNLRPAVRAVPALPSTPPAMTARPRLGSDRTERCT